MFTATAARAPRRLVLAGLCLTIAMLCGAARAQDDGCCQYRVRVGNQPERRCADLTREACVILKPIGSFLRGLKCDGQLQRCVHSVPTLTPTPPPTRTVTPTRTPTPRPQSLVRGCCQVNDPHRLGRSTCGNDIVESTCLGDFGNQAEFCETCTCSSGSEGGFSLAQGVCVPGTATVTATPTPTPVRAAIGCCQLDHLRRLDYSVCGNGILQLGCLGDYAGDPLFCLDCVCSSHADADFSLDPGACITRTPTPTPTRTPTPQLGCCELANFRGGHQSICGNVTEAACLAERRGTPRFCSRCTCSSRSAPGFEIASGSCINTRRPTRPDGPHIPRAPHSPR